MAFTGLPTKQSHTEVERLTSFFDLLVKENHAPEGAGIYIESLHDGIPLFGSGCIISGNEALFGGGLFIERVFTTNGVPPVSFFMFNTSFIDNTVSYGGSNVAFLRIPDSIETVNFCQNCSFSPCNSSLTTGYQDEQGFATCKLFVSSATPPLMCLFRS